MNSILKKIFGTLTEKPWEANQAAIDSKHSGQTFNISNQMSVVIIIFGISSVLFSLIFTGYLYSLPPGHDTTFILKTNILWINTLVLVISSFVFIRIQLASKKNNFEKARRELFFIGILAVLFLIGQLLVWQDLVQAGYYVSGSPANGYFYVFTTLHGFHLLGGLIYWAMTINKVWKLENIIIRKAKHTIELCAIYWHFLLAVWIVLFGLMLFS